VELLSPSYVLLFIGGVCGDQSGVVCYLLVCLLACAGVMPGGRCVVFRVQVVSQSLANTSYCSCTVRIINLLVCLLAGAGVMPGGRCVVFCVQVLSQSLANTSYCSCTVRIINYVVWCVGVGYTCILGLVLSLLYICC
jgi:hypothetical protein